MSKILVVFLIVCLSGCSSLAKKDHEYTWVKSTRPSLPMTVKILKEYPEDIKKLCGHVVFLWACAVYYVKDPNSTSLEYTECIVYTTLQNPPDFIIEHEKKHCDGWDHIEK